MYVQCTKHIHWVSHKQGPGSNPSMHINAGLGFKLIYSVLKIWSVLFFFLFKPQKVRCSIWRFMCNNSRNGTDIHLFSSFVRPTSPDLHQISGNLHNTSAVTINTSDFLIASILSCQYSVTASTFKKINVVSKPCSCLFKGCPLTLFLWKKKPWTLIETLGNNSITNFFPNDKNEGRCTVMKTRPCRAPAQSAAHINPPYCKLSVM